VPKDKNNIGSFTNECDNKKRQFDTHYFAFETK